MDRSSYFIQDKALFGSFPTQDSVEELEREGVRYFVDLTFSDEKNITLYNTNYVYISFPIKDQFYPENKVIFAEFIKDLINIILNMKPGEKMYIHCKGWHGRSGVVVAILLCNLYNFTPQQSITETSLLHSTRVDMKSKWITIGSPQTYLQKKFVYDFYDFQKN